MADVQPSSPLRIWHFFLVTTCIGGAIALVRLDRWLCFLQREQPLPTEFVSVIGQGLGCALLFLAWRAWRQRRLFASQPGHWLGILVGLTFVFEQLVCLIYLLTKLMATSDWEWGENLRAVTRFAYLGALLVICAVLVVAMRDASTLGLWRWAMGAALLACCILFCLTLEQSWRVLKPVLPPSWMQSLYLYMFQAYAFLTTASVAACVVAALLDLRRGAPKRDWQHWTGVFAAMLWAGVMVYHLALAGWLSLAWQLGRLFEFQCAADVC